MLHRVSPSDARLGMYVHALEGSWRDHPFWRTHFLLVDTRQLQQLRDSAIAGIVIDDEKGSAPEALTASLTGVDERMRHAIADDRAAAHIDQERPG